MMQNICDCLRRMRLRDQSSSNLVMEVESFKIYLCVYTYLFYLSVYLFIFIPQEVEYDLFIAV